MVWPFKNKDDNKKLVVSLSGDKCRLLLLESGESTRLIKVDSFAYQTTDDLQQNIQQWSKRNDSRGICCYWLLSRDIYQSLLIDRPDVAAENINEAARWLVKDQLQQAVDDTLISHYVPIGSPLREGQINLIAVKRSLVEKLVEISDQLGWNIAGIKIEELCTGYALASQLSEEKRIYGFIGADAEGLIFNFYRGRGLTFSRFIRGKLLPTASGSDEFSLDIDDEQARDSFLLEVQRTIDYATNQVYRESPTQLLLQGSDTHASELASLIREMTDIACDLPQLDIEDLRSEADVPLVELLAELGAINSADAQQQVDFYLDEFKPQPLTFNSQFAAWASLGVIALAMIFGSWQQYKLSQLESQKQQVESQHNELQQQLTEMEKALAAMNKNDNSENLLARKQAELNALNKIVAQLKRRDMENEIPYSAILGALAELDIQRLWLTEISIEQGVLSLSGSTTRREQIPRYIEALSAASPLRREFAEMQVEQDQTRSSLYHFDLKNGALKHGS